MGGIGSWRGCQVGMVTWRTGKYGGMPGGMLDGTGAK